MDLKNVFKECPVCMIWNKCWKLATSQQKSNFVHSYNRLRLISERIDSNIASHFFFVKSGHSYFIFAIYGKHVAKPRWRTVADSTAKLSSNWLYKALGFVNVKTLRNGACRSVSPAKSRVPWLFARPQRKPTHVASFDSRLKC